MDEQGALPDDVRAQIDAHLDAIERVLSARGMSRSQRRGILDDVQTQIVEMLHRRCPQGATMADARAVLAELDPPESYAQDRDSPDQAIPGGPLGVAPRTPRVAVIAAFWALAFPIFFFWWFSCYSVVPAGQHPPEPQLLLKLCMIAVLASGLTAPVGTTALGLLALSRIRRSRGRLCGRALALADALLYPLLALDGLLIWGAHSIGLALMRHDLQYRSSANHLYVVFAVAIGVVLAVILDLVLIRLAWRSAKAAPAN